MAPSPTIVNIQMPTVKALSDWFSELRAWFDVHHCQPTRFVSEGSNIYMIYFSDEAQAQRFAAAFSGYGTSVSDYPGSL